MHIIVSRDPVIIGVLGQRAPALAWFGGLGCLRVTASTARMMSNAAA
jgi:hypothetical protein